MDERLPSANPEDIARMNEPGGMLWWRDHYPQVDPQREWSIEELEALLRKTWLRKGFAGE